MGVLVSTGRDRVGLAVLAPHRGERLRCNLKLRFNYRSEEDSTKGLHTELSLLLSGLGPPDKHSWFVQEGKETLTEMFHSIPQPIGSIFLSRT